MTLPRILLCTLFLSLLVAAETPQLRAGASWNESRNYRDPVSGLEVKQITTQGIYNQGPTVHMNTAFPGGGHDVLFAGFRDAGSVLMTGDLDTGRLTAHYVIPATRQDSDEKKRMLRNLQFQGIHLAASPHHRKVVAARQGSGELLLLDLDDNTVRPLTAGDPEGRIVETPVFSADGRNVVYCSYAAELRGKERELAQRPMFYQSVALDGSDRKTLYFNAWGQSHIFPNPAKPELWIVKYGRPEFYFKGEERKQAQRQPDVFVLNAATGVTTPILPRNPYKRIAHLSWNRDGTRIVYHGQAESGGNFIGVMEQDGKVIWEHIFPEWSFERNGSNHICGDPAGEFIFDDGIAVPGQISLLDYRNAGPSGAPAIHPVARWENDWRGLPFQLSHPHPAVSPDGKYLVFYGCKEGKTNLYAVDIAPLREKLK